MHHAVRVTSEKDRDRDTRCDATKRFTHVLPHYIVATTE